MIANNNQANRTHRPNLPRTSQAWGEFVWHVDDLASAPRDFKIPKVRPVQVGVLAIMNIDMESVHDAASVRPDSKSVPVIRGFPGVGVVRQLRRNALQFFSETVKRYGDRVELRVLGRRAQGGLCALLKSSVTVPEA